VIATDRTYRVGTPQANGAFVAAARVGIAFKFGDDWVVDSTEVDGAEAYGDAVQHGGHYEDWEPAALGSGTPRRFTTHD
jgi:hypothetical protein